MFLVQAHHDLANLLAQQAARRGEAEVHFQEAVRLSASGPDFVAHKLQENRLLNDFAMFLHQGDQDEQAEQCWSQADATWRRLVAEHPLVPQYQYGLALYLQGHGYYGFQRALKNPALDDQQRQEALDRLQKELQDSQVLLVELTWRQPQDERYASGLYNGFNLLGNTLAQRGLREDAGEQYRRCADYLRGRLADGASDHQVFHKLGGVLNNLGLLSYQSEDYEAAAGYCREATEYSEKALATQPENIDFLTYYRNQTGLYANSLWRLDRDAEGDAAMGKHAATAEKLYAALPNDSNRGLFVRALGLQTRMKAARPGLSADEYRAALDDAARAGKVAVGDSQLLLQVAQHALTFRLGDPEPLLRWSREAENDPEAQDLDIEWAVAAVAEAQAGNSERARQCLARARESQSPHTPRGARLIEDLAAEVQAELQDQR
jgi:tetratricopeptide (TPR) repeat protein